MRVEEFFECGVIEPTVLLSHLDEKLLQPGHATENLHRLGALWRRLWVGRILRVDFRPCIGLEDHHHRWRGAARENLAAIPGGDDVRDLHLGLHRNPAVGLHCVEDDALAGHPIAALAVVEGRRRAPVLGFGHGLAPQIPISSLSSSGVINGPPAAALAWRAIVAALDLRVMPLSLMSRAIIALRMSGMALSRNSMMPSLGQAPSGFDQSSSAQASASSGKIAATAPASHGCGSSAVMRMSCSVSSCSVAACSARLLIQANNSPLMIHPHSASLNRPTGVPGGMGPSIWTTLRAAAIAAAVASRCH